MDGYIGFFRHRRIEVEACTSFEAVERARASFGVAGTRAAHEVHVVIAERDGEPVIHSTASIG